MLVFGSTMHIVTFGFIILELCMFCAQIVTYLIRPQDTHRKWYIFLLFLLVCNTVACSLLPDPNIPIPIHVQNILAIGFGFSMGSYFPYYFYKAFDIPLLKFHITFGVPLFIIVPYIVFFVIIYSISKDLAFCIKYGAIIPFTYSIILFRAIIRGIKQKHREDSNPKNYIEEIAVFCAMIPWSAVILLIYFKVSQPVEMAVTNSGFIVVSLIFIKQSMQRAKIEQKTYNLSNSKPVQSVNFELNFEKFRFTKREKEIVLLVFQGLKAKEIADKLNIAERTVTTHLQNVFEKARVSSKLELFYELEKTSSI